MKSTEFEYYFGDESLLKDREFILKVVKSHEFALKYADEIFKKDE